MKKLLEFTITASLALTITSASAEFGSEEFSINQTASTPTVNNSFFGDGTVRDVFCTNPSPPRCATEIKDGSWLTTVAPSSTFVQASFNAYVPPFNKPFDLTQSGHATAFEIRIRSSSQSFFGFLFDKYDRSASAPKITPFVDYNSPSFNTGGVWQIFTIPFSSMALHDGATSFQDVLTSTNGLSFGVLVAGVGKTIEVDYISSVVTVPEPSTLILLSLGMLLLLWQKSKRMIALSF